MQIMLKQFGHFNCLTFIHFFIVSLYFQVIFGQKVILKALETQCPTECGQVLKNGTDRLILRCEVDFKNVPETSLKTVVLETRKSSDVFTIVRLIRTSSGCVRDVNEDSYCEKVDSDGIYHMVFNITALVKYSEADARVAYTNSSSSIIESRILKFPKISEDVAPVTTISTHTTLQITTTPVPMVQVEYITNNDLKPIKDLLTALLFFVIFILVVQVLKFFWQIRSRPLNVFRARYTDKDLDVHE